jgi:hypothetical protein
MRKVVAIVAAAICSCGTATAAVAQSNRLTLPLPSQGKTVSIPIGQGIDLVAMPDQSDWVIQAVEAQRKGFPPNLFYPTAEWHGPIPSDIMAWQVLKHFGFGNTRWVCVSGHPIVVELKIRNAHVKPVSDGRVAIFTSGKLIIEWFHRPCKDIPGYG